MDDPVMGGASVSTFAREGKTGVWSGEVKVVQSLGAPGFCTLRTKDSQVPHPHPHPTPAHPPPLITGRTMRRAV